MKSTTSFTPQANKRTVITSKSAARGNAKQVSSFQFRFYASKHAELTPRRPAVLPITPQNQASKTSTISKYWSANSKPLQPKFSNESSNSTASFMRPTFSSMRRSTKCTDLNQPLGQLEFKSSLRFSTAPIQNAIPLLPVTNKCQPIDFVSSPTVSSSTDLMVTEDLKENSVPAVLSSEQEISMDESIVFVEYCTYDDIHLNDNSITQ